MGFNKKYYEWALIRSTVSGLECGVILLLSGIWEGDGGRGREYVAKKSGEQSLALAGSG